MFKLNKNRFEQHLNESWGNKTCPMCHSNQWSYDDTIFTPVIVDSNKSMAVGGKFMPLVAVTCLHCGNTVFINGMVANAIDDNETKARA